MRIVHSAAQLRPVNVKSCVYHSAIYYTRTMCCALPENTRERWRPEGQKRQSFCSAPRRSVSLSSRRYGQLRTLPSRRRAPRWSHCSPHSFAGSPLDCTPLSHVRAFEQRAAAVWVRAAAAAGRTALEAAARSECCTELVLCQCARSATAATTHQSIINEVPVATLHEA